MTPSWCLVCRQRPSCQPKGASQGLDPTRVHGVQFLKVAIWFCPGTVGVSSFWILSGVGPGGREIENKHIYGMGGFAKVG
jgi:hypothetical protein